LALGPVRRAARRANGTPSRAASGADGAWTLAPTGRAGSPPRCGRPRGGRCGTRPARRGRKRSQRERRRRAGRDASCRSAVYTLPVRSWGLTGNIGSGKTTVGRMLSTRGIPVVDADQVAREIVEPGRPALREIASRFPGALLPDGSLDRKALAARVFADPADREALNRIVHPRIAEEVAGRMAALAAAGEKIAVYEAALIVENGLQQGLDGL